MFDTIAPRFASRSGGYSRIIKLGNRKGDGADLAIIELLGSELEVKLMLARLIDVMKSRQITVVFTSLTDTGGPPERTDVGVSSLMDVWMLLENLEARGERTRGIQIVKARGAAHSSQVREFALTDRGLALVDVGEADRRVAGGSAPSARP